MVDEEEPPAYDDITKSSEDITGSTENVITTEPKSNGSTTHENVAFAMPPPSYDSLGTTDHVVTEQPKSGDPIVIVIPPPPEKS